jgi:hypothetical protein
MTLQEKTTEKPVKKGYHGELEIFWMLLSDILLHQPDTCKGSPAND